MIELWDGYAIDADDRQFILGKPTIRAHPSRGTEEQRMEDATYHATITQPHDRKPNGARKTPVLF